MNNEKLIKIIREYKLLYDLSDKRYSDNQKKDEAWTEIGIKLKMNGKECKKAWALLRDAFRRAVKKRKATKSGQAGLPEKKWKYEDEMCFLLPYTKERQTICTLPTASGLANHDTGDEVAEEGPAAEEIVQSPAVIQQSTRTLPSASSPQRKRKKKGQKSTKETPSTVLMRYIVESKKNTPPDDTEQFFAGITITVRSFPLRDRATAKAKIFEIVSNMEIDIPSRPFIPGASVSSCHPDYSPRQNYFDTVRAQTPMPDTNVDFYERIPNTQNIK